VRDYFFEKLKQEEESMKNFRAYQESKELYLEAKNLTLKFYIKDQLLRASSSICLNLAEGNNRRTSNDRRKFFNIAFTSLREVQAILDIESITLLEKQADRLAAMIFKLINRMP